MSICRNIKIDQKLEGVMYMDVMDVMEAGKLYTVYIVFLPTRYEELFA